MNRTKKIQQIKSKASQLATVDTSALQADYISELETNPKYSLDVDPENKYSMTSMEKDFVKYYVEYKSVGTAAELTNIDADTAKEFFTSYAVQTEIRRINLALYHRQFSARLLNIDEIGGYLSSLITNDNVPEADRLKTSEKLKVIDQLIKLNELKGLTIGNPETVMKTSFEQQVKNLSVMTIVQLIKQSNTADDKSAAINALDINGTLSPEEKSYLETLPTEELLKLINDSNNGGQHE